MKTTEQQGFAARIGLDWADSKHDICLQADGGPLEYLVLQHSPEAIDDWARKLRERFDGAPVAVCLELAKGPIVSALQKYDFFVLFPVNPKSLASYRDVWAPSGAKDDPSDARLALELLTKHQDRLTELRPQSPQMRALQQLVEDRRRLVADRTRITNRMCAALKSYFPQVLQWFGDRNTGVFCSFILRFPDLQTARAARPNTLRNFFHANNVRRAATIDECIAAIKSARALTEDAGVVEPSRRFVLAQARQLQSLNETIAEYDQTIAELSKQMDDYTLFKSFPGAAAAWVPRLMVAFGEDRQRYGGADEIQKYSGVAPVMERSGNSEWVHFRFRCPTFMRQTFVEWAGQSIPHSYWADAYYRQQLAKGAKHQSAVRSLAFKWIRILYRCWKDRRPYDEVAYLKVLKQRGSPLVCGSV